MKVTDQIHAIKIPFKVPVSPEVSVDRFAFGYLIFGDRIHLIDSGVAGSESIIFEYIDKQGRSPKEVSTLILTHSHPDHIGAAKSIKNQTGCTVFAHKDEQSWIEDTKQQFNDRPVPGFFTLVEGSVGVDHLVNGGEILELEKEIGCNVIHTPGHSKGSISLLFEGEKSLFTADALAFPGDLPIYEDISSSIASIKTLQQIGNIENLFSSWEPPIQGQEKISKRMEESIAYLKRIHTAVINNSSGVKNENIMELCQKVVGELGLPPFAAMPLVAKAFASSLVAEQKQTIAH
ncbi:MAG: MBL fold metallo-hydrolase [Desulfocapsa sp.]|nr:MBL fold metallo-hydrolase [Desulfocapsa sp.]